MKIEYTNMAKGENKLVFISKYLLHILRTWYLFNFKFSWVNYKGFVRVMRNVRFAKMNITIGDKVQLGKDTKVACDLVIGNYVLIAGQVSFVGRNDHQYNLPGTTMWDSPRGKDSATIIQNDVWIGSGSTIIAGVNIGKGAVIAAGSLVNKNIPDFEIWGGVPARKIKDRFVSPEDKKTHKLYLESLS